MPPDAWQQLKVPVRLTASTRSQSSRVVDGGRAPADAGAVDEDVDRPRPPAGTSTIASTASRFATSTSEHDRDSPTALRRRRAPSPGVGNHEGACVGKPERDRFPEPAGRPGNTATRPSSEKRAGTPFIPPDYILFHPQEKRFSWRSIHGDRRALRRYRKLYMPAVCDALYELGLPERFSPPRSGRSSPSNDRRRGVHGQRPRDRAAPRLGRGNQADHVRTSRCSSASSPTRSWCTSNGDSPVGHFGELTANSASQQGCVGCILDGNLRDIEGLREIGFQVFYRDLSPLNGSAAGRWSPRRSPSQSGASTVDPGDIVIGEFDGVSSSRRRCRARAPRGRGDRRRGKPRARRHARRRLAASRASRSTAIFR